MIYMRFTKKIKRKIIETINKILENSSIIEESLHFNDETKKLHDSLYEILEEFFIIKKLSKKELLYEITEFEELYNNINYDVNDIIEKAKNEIILKYSVNEKNIINFISLLLNFKINKKDLIIVSNFHEKHWKLVFNRND